MYDQFRTCYQAWLYVQVTVKVTAAALAGGGFAPLAGGRFAPLAGGGLAPLVAQLFVFFVLIAT